MIRAITSAATLLITLVLATGSAWAQNRESNVVYMRHQVVNLDGDVIDGNLIRPDGAYLEARKLQRTRNLIQLRTNFRKEILQSLP